MLNSIYARIAVVTTAVAFFVGLLVGGWMLARRAPRLFFWCLLATIAAVLVWALEFRLPARYLVDPDLPVFQPYAWTWILALALACLATVGALVNQYWMSRAAPPAEAVEPAGSEDLDAAWETIRLRLGQAGINPADQRVFLLLAPDEGSAGALIESAGLQLFARSPEVPAPIHAYATAEGLFLSISGATRFGGPGGEASAARLEHLCRTLLALDPDRPVVRGVVVIFPAAWASQADAPARASAVREDLRAIRSTLKLRLPVFAVVTQGETLPGLAAFIGRIPEPMRLSRCGFAVPSSVSAGAELLQRGLSWLAGWFDTWSLNLMSGDIADSAGNGRLLLLTSEIRRRRKRWRDVMEAAFATHRGSEPFLLRGCYLAACGDAADERAFSAGLLRGARSRIVADHVWAEWSDEARRDDRVYRRAALAVGLVGGVLTLVAWWWIVGQHPLWWIGFGLVALAWIATITRLILRS